MPADSINEILKTLMELTKCGRVIKHIATGSIIFTIICPTRKSHDDMYDMEISGKLQTMFNGAFISKEDRQKGVAISMKIDEGETLRECLICSLLDCFSKYATLAMFLIGCLIDKINTCK